MLSSTPSPTNLSSSRQLRQPSSSSSSSAQPLSPTNVTVSTTRNNAGGPPTRNTGVAARGGQRPRAADFSRAPSSAAVSGAMLQLLPNDEPHSPTPAELERQQLRDAAGGVATIDLGAMRRNFRLGMAMVGGVPPGAVVKANGYGLGADIVAKTLISEGCRDFFVARISEAVELRKALRAEYAGTEGFKQGTGTHPVKLGDDAIAINVLDGNLAGADPELLIKNRITPVLNSFEQVMAWNEAGEKLGKQLPAILQFDSGMSRAGMGQEEMYQLRDALKEGRLKNIKPQLIMTHLAKSGTAEPASGPDLRTPQGEAPQGATLALRGDLREREAGVDTQRQLYNFESIAKFLDDVLPGIPKSIGASSTVFLTKDLEGGPSQDLRKDMVRMGGTFHGQAPFDADSNPLEQVMTLKSKLAQINHYPAGAEVGYSGKFTTDKAMTLATIPLGYADGLPRRDNGNRPEDAGKERPYVLVDAIGKDGKRPTKAEFVGANSMDMSSIDVSNVRPDQLKAGLSVTLMGDGITPDHFGDMFGTNASETQTKLAGRVFKEYVDEDAPSLNAQPNMGAGSKFAKDWDGI